MREVVEKLYRFDELSPQAKEKALEKMRNTYLWDEWWDTVYEDAKTIGKLMGVDIDRIYFSGFWSQGDGACFEGSFGYAKGCYKNVCEYAPLDEEIKGIAQSWQDIQRRYFYGISGSVSHRGHYHHSGCTSFSIDMGERNSPGRYSAEYGEVEGEVEQILREFMDWIYTCLEKEHEYLTSDEVLIESASENEDWFYEDGSMY